MTVLEEEVNKKYLAYMEFYAKYRSLADMDKPPLKAHLNLLLDEWMKAKETAAKATVAS